MNIQHDSYGWTDQEVTMPLLFNGFVIRYAQNLVKCAARDDVPNKQIIVRTTDGKKTVFTNASRGEGRMACVRVCDAWWKKKA